MSRPAVLAIDQGTSNTKALLIDAMGAVVASAARPVRLTHSKPGWAEQDAKALWSSVVEAVADVCQAAGEITVAAVALTNQRETALAWDGATGEPVGPAVSWQCKRSSELCDQLRESNEVKAASARSGLPIDPMFSAGKLAWILDNTPGARTLAASGRLRVGTVDSWLVWNLTAGAVHATDHSNASRTQLFDIAAVHWDPALCELYGVPSNVLPELRSSDAHFGTVAAAGLDRLRGAPIIGVMGDSHAALFAHGDRAGDEGLAKATIGTGSSVMVATKGLRSSSHGLSSTIAWSRTGQVRYALEGNIVVSGQAAAFASQLLGLSDVDALSALAASVADSGGVVFVPALAGLGAPHWDDRARGMISGLSLATTPAHIAHATLQAIAGQIADVVEAMEADIGHALPCLTVDGGASSDDLLLQSIANLVGAPVHRAAVPEASALGVGRMAWQVLGGWSPEADGAPAVEFQPKLADAERKRDRTAWRAEIARARLP